MNSQKKTVSLGLGFATCLTWFGYHCGSGFATGAQVPTYITKFGLSGYLVPLIAFLVVGICLWVGGKFALKANCKTYKEFAERFYTHGKLRTLFVILWDLIATFVLFVGFGGCIAGGASMLNTQFGLNYWVAAVIFTLILNSLLLIGDSDFVSKFMDRLSKLTLPMVVMLATMALVGIFSNWDGLMSYFQTTPFFNEGYNASSIASSAYTYIGTQVVFLNSFVAFLTGTIKEERYLKQGILGGTPLNAGILCLMATFCMAFGGCVGQALPYLYILNDIGIPGSAIFRVFYIIIMTLALISTGTSCLFASTVRFLPYGKRVISNDTTRRRVIVLFFSVVCLAISGLGLMAIVTTGYSMLANLVGPVIVLPILLYGPYRLKHYKPAPEELKSSDKGQ